jgi:hypothetical protein
MSTPALTLVPLMRNSSPELAGQARTSALERRTSHLPVHHRRSPQLEQAGPRVEHDGVGTEAVGLLVLVTDE